MYKSQHNYKYSLDYSEIISIITKLLTPILSNYHGSKIDYYNNPPVINTVIKVITIKLQVFIIKFSKK